MHFPSPLAPAPLRPSPGPRDAVLQTHGGRKWRENNRPKSTICRCRWVDAHPSPFQRRWRRNASFSGRRVGQRRTHFKTCRQRVRAVEAKKRARGGSTATSACALPPLSSRVSPIELHFEIAQRQCATMYDGRRRGGSESRQRSSSGPQMRLSREEEDALVI